MLDTLIILASIATTNTNDGRIAEINLATINVARTSFVRESRFVAPAKVEMVATAGTIQVRKPNINDAQK